MKIGVFMPELLRHLFKKPATVDYPFKKLEVPEGFRGTPFLHPELCIVCKACERDCPAEAIEITSVDEATAPPGVCRALTNAIGSNAFRMTSSGKITLDPIVSLAI